MAEFFLHPLSFTTSTAKQGQAFEEPKNDAIEAGGFPAEQKIKSITTIEVFTNGKPDDSTVVGLNVTYSMQDGASPKVIPHGDTNKAGGLKYKSFGLTDDQILVGVSGRRAAGQDEGISSIYFHVFDTSDGSTTTPDTFKFDDTNAGSPFGSFGAIYAFYSTPKTAGSTLTSLGLVKIVGGAPEQGVLGH